MVGGGGVVIAAAAGKGWGQCGSGGVALVMAVLMGMVYRVLISKRRAVFISILSD